MKILLAAMSVAAVLVAPAFAQDHAGHAVPSVQNVATRNPNLPPDNDAAKEQIATSPRHGEWVDIKTPNGPALNSFVIYPERRTKAPVVIVVHDIGGMSDWIRGLGDQLAREGFIAIVPDLLSGKGPNGGGTSSLGDQVGQTIRTLTTDELKTRLDVVMAYGKALPSANGKTGTIGFCWGGGTVFNYAWNSRDSVRKKNDSAGVVPRRS